MKNVFMKNRNLDINILQNYIGAIQIIAAVALLKTYLASRGLTYLGEISGSVSKSQEKSAETFI